MNAEAMPQLSLDPYCIMQDLYSKLPEDELKNIHTLLCCAIDSDACGPLLSEQLLSKGLTKNEITVVCENLNHELWKSCNETFNDLKKPENAFDHQINIDDITMRLLDRLEALFDIIPEFKQKTNRLFPTNEDKESAMIYINLLQAHRKLGSTNVDDDSLNEDQKRFLANFSNSELDAFEEFLTDIIN
jgi:uncharacterized membrane-anchored protein YjiN (DUF445 family)